MAQTPRGAVKVAQTGKRIGGRKKGVPNKVTADLKAMILAALDDAGGQRYLLTQARKKNPAPFLALIAKVLPLQITGDPDAPIVTRVEVAYVEPADKPD